MTDNSFDVREKKIAQFGNWKVDKNGNLDYKNGRYTIESDRLEESNWIDHLSGKGWIDWNDFIPAYFQAMRNADIQFIKMRVFW